MNEKSVSSVTTLPVWQQVTNFILIAIQFYLGKEVFLSSLNSIVIIKIDQIHQIGSYVAVFILMLAIFFPYKRLGYRSWKHTITAFTILTVSIIAVKVSNVYLSQFLPSKEFGEYYVYVKHLNNLLVVLFYIWTALLATSYLSFRHEETLRIYLFIFCTIPALVFLIAILGYFGLNPRRWFIVNSDELYSWKFYCVLFSFALFIAVHLLLFIYRWLYNKQLAYFIFGAILLLLNISLVTMMFDFVVFRNFLWWVI